MNLISNFSLNKYFSSKLHKLYKKSPNKTDIGALPSSNPDLSELQMDSDNYSLISVKEDPAETFRFLEELGKF